MPPCCCFRAYGSLGGVLRGLWGVFRGVGCSYWFPGGWAALWGGCGVSCERLSRLGLRASVLCGRVVVVHARFFDRFMLRLRSCAFHIGLPLVWCFHQAGGFLYPFTGDGRGFACSFRVCLGCVFASAVFSLFRWVRNGAFSLASALCTGV